MPSRIEDLDVENIHINTVAKTASASFLHSLKNKSQDVRHTHNLRDLANVVNDSKNTLIISGIRNPLDRNISYFFQTYSDNFYNNVKTAANEYRGEHCYVMSKEDLLKASPLELISIFLSQQIHFTFNEWFYEFFDVTKILDIAFDKKQGIKLYHLPNNNHVLLYTFESLGANELFIKSFFGINEFLHSNNSKQREYADKYQSFKRLLTLEPEYKSKLLSTPIMKYFYTNDEINSFFQKY